VLRPDARGETRTFEAIKLELLSLVETGQIEIARAVKHPFIAEEIIAMKV